MKHFDHALQPVVFDQPRFGEGRGLQIDVGEWQDMQRVAIVDTAVGWGVGLGAYRGGDYGRGGVGFGQ